jgi:hypothetical protein
VREGGRGDEGQQARECSTPRIAPENSTLEKARPPRGCAGRPRPQTRRRRALPGHCHLTGAGFFGEAPARHLPFQASRRPNAPFSPCGRRGAGGMRGNRRGECSTPRIAPENSTLEKALPPRGCAGVPARRRAGGARSQALPPYRGRFFGEAPARHLPFQASRRPNAPFSPRVAVLTKVEPDRQVEHSWE